LLLTVGAALFATNGFSQTPNVNLKVQLPPTIQKSDATEKEILDQLTRRARMRLGAADLIDFSVSRTEGGIEIIVRDGLSRHYVESLVVPQGKMVIARTIPLGEHWTKHSGKLSDSIEIRQPETSLDPEDAYLWSRSYKKLQNFTNDKANESGVSVNFYPIEGGWRTVGYGSPVATQNDLVDAEYHQTGDSDPYVEIDLDTGIKGATNRLGENFAKWVIIVDGGVVAFSGSVSTKTKSRLTLSPPDQIAGEEARTKWARQIAARLKAPYPFDLKVAD
jgi:hypothetical protein